MTAQLSGTLASGQYLHWGVIHVSLTNLTIVLVMVLVFVAALLLPFPHHEDPQQPPAPVRGEQP